MLRSYYFMTTENNNYTIYCHRNMINNKAYIGQTCLSVEDRWKKGTHYKTCTAFNRAIEKYGWDNFEHFIIMEHLTQEQANHYEELLIALFNTRAPNGYNLDAGGNNHHHSPETIERIREKALSRKLSEETKQKISAKVSGKIILVLKKYYV